ncbi:MAG: type II toxin-antitoxin system RelB/DinJ family antitoxin [Coprobacillus sp.]|nr:type II toxin-antitoxin system RelB/DinJ family antitoxin [Coprobacillus sp.]
MAKTATLCVRLDPTLKEEGDDILKDIGVSASTLITMLYKQLVEKRGIPFEVSTRKERKEPLDVSKLTHDELIAEIEKGYRDIEEGREIDAEEFFKRFDKEHNL